MADRNSGTGSRQLEPGWKSGTSTHLTPSRHCAHSCFWPSKTSQTLELSSMCLAHLTSVPFVVSPRFLAEGGRCWVKRLQMLQQGQGHWCWRCWGCRQAVLGGWWSGGSAGCAWLCRLFGIPGHRDHAQNVEKPSPRLSIGDRTAEHFLRFAWVGTWLSLAGTATSIIFVMTKHVFCHNKCMLAATKTKLLPWQNYVRRDKIFVMTNTKVLSQQGYFCHDTRRVLLQQTCVCHDKSKLVVTKVCHHKNAWHDKHLSWQKFCCHKNMFVATSILLSRQDIFCRNKTDRPRWAHSWQYPVHGWNNDDLLVALQLQSLIRWRVVPGCLPPRPPPPPFTLYFYTLCAFVQNKWRNAYLFLTGKRDILKRERKNNLVFIMILSILYLYWISGN